MLPPLAFVETGKLVLLGKVDSTRRLGLRLFVQRERLFAVAVHGNDFAGTLSSDGLEVCSQTTIGGRGNKPAKDVALEETDELTKTERQNGGFGSTGV